MSVNVIFPNVLVLAVRPFADVRVIIYGFCLSFLSLAVIDLWPDLLTQKNCVLGTARTLHVFIIFVAFDLARCSWPQLSLRSARFRYNMTSEKTANIFIILPSCPNGRHSAQKPSECTRQCAMPANKFSCVSVCVYCPVNGTGYLIALHLLQDGRMM